MLAIKYDFSKLPSKIKYTRSIITEYEKYVKYTDTLSGFLTYVWNKNDSNNFQEYTDIMSVLYPDINDRKPDGLSTSRLKLDISL